LVERGEGAAPKTKKTRRGETDREFIKLARAITRVLGFKPATEIVRRLYAYLPTAAYAPAGANTLWYGNAGHDIAGSFGHDSRPVNYPSATP
jgi:hypothetical protein